MPLLDLAAIADYPSGVAREIKPKRIAGASRNRLCAGSRP